MKPKERFLNYALLSSASCDQKQNLFKEDIPIDLSTKRPSPIGHNFGLFKACDHPQFPSPPHGAEWSAKYCIPNLMAKQYGYPPAIFPYLFINPNCLPGHEIERKHEDPLYEQFALPYRLPQDGLILPLNPYGQHLYRNPDRTSDGERAPLCSESSSSSASSSPYDQHEYYHPQPQPQEYQDKSKRTYRSVPPPTQEHIISPSTKGSQVVSSRAKLKKSFSFPNLSPTSKRSSLDQSTNVRRIKSEHNLHLIKSSVSPSKICAPKKIFASNYYQNIKENSKECKENNNKDVGNRCGNGGTTRFYRNYRKEVIECWDNENKDARSQSEENALDLRTNNPLHKLPNGVEKSKLSGCPDNDCHNEALLGKMDLKHPAAMPMDIYHQYYYYLIQEPAFASRAAVAYAKLLHSNKGEDKTSCNFAKSSSPDQFEHGSPYETKRASPDFIMNGSRTELRSADTTNSSLPFDRKRISRPLTGKHVRHGTGASPSTLVSLRNMIQQRQKLKDVTKFDGLSRYGKTKANKRIKRK